MSGWSPTARSRRDGPIRFGRTVAAAVVVGALAWAGIASGAGGTTRALENPCPWTTAPPGTDPARLAAEVLGQMTESEKIGEVGLTNTVGYENQNAGVPRLCIPPLTLQDGPNGIAGGHTGVTQLPASIGVAATFDPKVAYAYGQVLGDEARHQGIDAVQAPDLNLARLPNDGRIFEGYGEDPTLVSAMGVADIEGIQSQGVMADAKHLGVYTQETDRYAIDQVVSQRALQEVYLAPFRAAVRQAHVASIMCGQGDIDGVPTCEDPALFAELWSWGFDGFVRSDLGAAHDPVAAFDAGLDLIKPAGADQLSADLADGRLGTAQLNAAVLAVLTAQFRYGLVQHPLTGPPATCACTPAHAAVALRTAERSMVLLKDSGGILPLGRSRLRSVAVIGQDAGSQPMTTGFGSGEVLAPMVSAPVDAIREWLGPRVALTYTPGGPLLRGPVRSELGAPTYSSGASTAGLSAAIDTAGSPGTGEGWESWTGTIDPSTNGLYEFSLTAAGDTWLSVGGSTVVAEPGVELTTPWDTAVPLRAGHPYRVQLRWYDTGAQPPTLSWTDVTPMIDAAAEAARRAQTALVFVSDVNSEGFDRPTLSLPGDDNALIDAVAAANRHTVVVLNTGGPVLMPWLRRVAAVLEAWYPGEEDGAATVAVLSGAVDPSGHLPVTFPASQATSPMGQPSSWPGVDDAVDTGLAVGYRYYDEHRLRPLFPFGYGLSYTTFGLSHPSLRRAGKGVTVHLQVTDEGHSPGRAVVQVYVAAPSAAGEPALALAAFASVPLEAGQARTVALAVPEQAFESYLGGGFRVVGGRYTVLVGSSAEDLPIRLSVNMPGRRSVSMPGRRPG